MPYRPTYRAPFSKASVQATAGPVTRAPTVPPLYGHFIATTDAALAYTGEFPLQAAPFKGLKTKLAMVPNDSYEREEVSAVVRLAFELAHMRWESLVGCPSRDAVRIAYRYHRSNTISVEDLNSLRRAYPTSVGAAFTGLSASNRSAWLKTIQTRELLHLQGQPVYSWIE